MLKLDLNHVDGLRVDTQIRVAVGDKKGEVAAKVLHRDDLGLLESHLEDESPRRLFGKCTCLDRKRERELNRSVVGCVPVGKDLSGVDLFQDTVVLPLHLTPPFPSPPNSSGTFSLFFSSSSNGLK